MKTVKRIVSKLLPIGEMMSDRVFAQAYGLSNTIMVFEIKSHIVNELDDEIN